MSSSIYEIFHYIPPTINQCLSTSLNNNNLSNSSSFFIPLQQPFLPCQLHNITDNYTNHVQLVDSNYLMRAPTHFDCYILLFFARWCQFSVRFAPYFNAIPRVFPGLDFVAYDVSKSLRYVDYKFDY
jgi:thiol-disulfide isomerase/thioredoxin